MSDDELRGDYKNAIQMLAADNARLCEIAIRADELAKAAEELVAFYTVAGRGLGTGSGSPYHLNRVLERYKITRQGQ